MKYGARRQDAYCRYDVTWQRGDINLASKMRRRRRPPLIARDAAAGHDAYWWRLLMLQTVTGLMTY
jgi:hypothetical protein